MKESILFSIVIPTYKGEHSLFIALNSIAHQTYKNIEVIVSDDNGPQTDSQIRTQEVVNRFKSVLNITYLINNHVNGSHARNKGLEVASGEYISLLDDDDFYLESYVEDAINSFEENDVVFFDTVIISEENIYKKISSPSITSKRLLFFEDEIGTGSNICFKRKIIDDGNYFDERYHRYQDIEFVCKLLKKYTYKWINKINIVKYYNDVNNYPLIDTALSMQELLRDDMLNKEIINSFEYKELEKKQLHCLYNDYLVKNIDKKDIQIIYNKLKELDDLSIVDKIMFQIYSISKRLFNVCFSIYARKNIQNNDGNKNKYLEYRDVLKNEAK